MANFLLTSVHQHSNSSFLLDCDAEYRSHGRQQILQRDFTQSCRRSRRFLDRHLAEVWPGLESLPDYEFCGLRVSHGPILANELARGDLGRRCEG